MNDITMSRLREAEECDRQLSEALAENWEGFVKVGVLLNRMREGNQPLYKVLGFKTFEAYCKERHDIGKSYAYQLIDSSELRRKLPDLSGNDGQNWTERSVHELKRLKSPTKAKAIAERVVKEVKEAKAKGEKVKLGSVVRKHVDQALGTDRKPKPPERPMFAEVVFKYLGEIKGMTAVIEGISEDALLLLGKSDPRLVKDFADAVARLQKVWEVTRPAPAAGRRTLEV